MQNIVKIYNNYIGSDETLGEVGGIIKISFTNYHSEDAVTANQELL